MALPPRQGFARAIDGAAASWLARAMPSPRAAAPFPTLLLVLAAALLLPVTAPVTLAETTPPPAIELWPGAVPGETPASSPEADLTKPSDGLVAGRRLIRLGNVTKPTMTIHRPPPDRDTGAAVLVCPGGAYNILALDLEGTEVCEWLNQLGVTGVVLKYRVPRRTGLEKQAAPLQDAQRALRLLRHRAGEWNLDPKRIGVLGFSAGGHLSAALSTNPELTYPRQDAADDAGGRPDFTVLVYPAYLAVEGDADRLSPEIKVDDKTPPAFVVMTQDDPVRVENAFVYTRALHRAKVPFELHLHPKGGHGYGLRRTDVPVTAWTDVAGAWLKSQGWLARRP